MGLESALVAADSTLHLGLADPDQLEKLFAQLSKWPGIQKLHVVLRMMDGRAESPGESRSRYLFWRHGVPAPELQLKIYDQNGVLIAVVDFAWPDQGVFGEFDGEFKYGRLLKPGQEAGEVVFAEKQREDQIRDLTGWRCGRIIWRNLDQHPQTTARRFTRLLKIPG